MARVELRRASVELLSTLCEKMIVHGHVEDTLKVNLYQFYPWDGTPHRGSCPGVDRSVALGTEGSFYPCGGVS